MFLEILSDPRILCRPINIENKFYWKKNVIFQMRRPWVKLLVDMPANKNFMFRWGAVAKMPPGNFFQFSELFKKLTGSA